MPGRLGNLHKLEALVLGNNKIKSLPKNMLTLTSLTSLMLENNRLKELPNSLGLIPNLQVCFMWSGAGQLRLLCSALLGAVPG